MNNDIKFTDETQLVSWFIEFFKDDFHIVSEVKGVHLCTNKKVRIDLLAYPKKHIIEAGFDECYFGIEVKYFNGNKFLKSGSSAFYQTISYVTSEFYTKNKIIKPSFCLLFSNFSFDNIFENASENSQKEYEAFKHLSNHYNVGTIDIGRYMKSGKREWHFKFANQDYFRERHYGYMIGKKHVIQEKHAGNIQ